ncbi:MAG: DUF1854 domain-containing protein [Clostridia bacterium]|nr:DUF1854 domain-containing protein [Clostridia bacterium]
MTERRYLTRNDKITRGENNLVSLAAGGESYRDLEPRRLFPVSRELEYITLLDEDGREVAVIRSINDIDEESQEVIKSSLDSYYLVPRITSVINIVQKYGNIHFDVNTDRGPLSFDVLRGNDIKLFRGGAVRVRDSNDNRYVIPDYRKLDKKSRAKLTIYL